MIEIKVVVPDGPLGTPAWNPEKQELGFIPTFYRGERTSLAANLYVEVNGVKHSQFALKINGKTGELTLIDRSHPVKAPLEEPPVGPKPAVPETPK